MNTKLAAYLTFGMEKTARVHPAVYHALAGAVPGAAVGALAGGDDHRLEGAGLGALSGGALGVGGGYLLRRAARAKAIQDAIDNNVGWGNVSFSRQEFPLGYEATPAEVYRPGAPIKNEGLKQHVKSTRDNLAKRVSVYADPEELKRYVAGITPTDIFYAADTANAPRAQPEHFAQTHTDMGTFHHPKLSS